MYFLHRMIREFNNLSTLICKFTILRRSLGSDKQDIPYFHEQGKRISWRATYPDASPDTRYKKLTFFFQRHTCTNSQREANALESPDNRYRRRP